MARVSITTNFLSVSLWRILSALILTLVALLALSLLCPSYRNLPSLSLPSAISHSLHSLHFVFFLPFSFSLFIPTKSPPLIHPTLSYRYGTTLVFPNHAH